MQHSAAVSTMPQALSTSSSGSSSNIERIFLAALKSYQKKTKKDLKNHDLFQQLESCDSPAAILAVFQADRFDPSRTGNNDRLNKWLIPTINVLCAFSDTLDEGISLVFPPAKVVFAGVGVLLLAAKDVAASQDTLMDIFGRIESFCVRLETYTNVPLTPAMTNKMVQITVEILDILATATKVMKQSLAKKFVKRVVGWTALEDGIKKLDKLTNEEVAMATAQLLRVTHNIDNEVTGVDEGVRRVDEDVKRKQLRERLRKWQSPPDPSTNHHLIGDRQHKGTTEWFMDSDKYHKWKAAGSLLLVHGKPGCGKSVLCSAIINDVTTLCKAGLASMAYFYFDFRDVDKKSRRNLLRSLLVQLSTSSDAFCDILSGLYESCGSGARQPSDKGLMRCFEEMLTVPNQGQIYLILDALDGCPNTFDVPSPRKQVLDLVTDLVGLRLPDLRICITSRLEVDIGEALEPLASQIVSLQNELGQKKDIVDYIRAVVYSDSSILMKRWRKEDKEHVIQTLSERADGMFLWVFCQLEMLQNCLPQHVRRILQQLPASLDETYERVLRDILRADPDQAYRLLQCLTVATRPLRVDELAEILALDFPETEGGVPVLNKDWRWDDEQQGVLATCSSLIVVVDTDDRNSWRKTRIVQFAHLSVKEFLTSDRLADIKADISRFHIRLEPAHTVIAQSCLAILLQSDHDDRANSTSALSMYAAQHWVDHAHFGNVSLRVEYGMRRLFDPAKKHFTAWLNSYNLDIEWESFLRDGPYSHPNQRSKFISLGEDDAPLCLYYAALCGFRDLTRYLITKYPQHVDATVGLNKSPLAAALRNRHIQVAELLHQHGAVLPIGYNGRTLLHAAAADGLVDIAKWLLGIGTDVNARAGNHRTPLYFAAANGRLDIVRMLLRHGADVHARDESQSTPLHRAQNAGTAQLLIEHGGDVHARDQRQSTPLHLVSSEKGNAETVQLLIRHGADFHARDESQSTPLHLASSEKGNAETVQLLIMHGADVHAQDQSQSTPLQLALSLGISEIAWLLIKHGVDVHARDESQSTLLHLVSSSWDAGAAQLLIKHGVDVHARDENQSTLLHLVSSSWDAGAAQLLIKHGADVHVRDESQSTPLHLASSRGNAETVQLLIKHGADVHARDESHSTPLHLATSEQRNAETVQLLIKHGADVHARNQRQSTPLHRAQNAGTAQLLIEHGADVHARDEGHSTPLHLALSRGDSKIAQLLIKHGTDVHVQNQDQSTPLHMASSSPSWMNMEPTVRLLIERGANVNACDENHQTPLHRLSSCWDPNAGSLRLLLKNGADVDVEDDKGLTPFQIASSKRGWPTGHCEIAQMLLDHRARIVSNTK